ncbi:MAG: hypothetical protein IJ535_00010 [Pseudobutyrivibrio sp.]|uniref:hypothetical protein n=1 Tax=Pseudobutyrivibrio sp. TaxID=2014367 RepID=UPI0025EC070E|nr:hypothetical protein [Pseudobutyrivibrio sp.]MBQ8488142.1 hypothetical protein [Pseudobutyrivibrio sp.]
MEKKRLYVSGVHGVEYGDYYFIGNDQNNSICRIDRKNNEVKVIACSKLDKYDLLTCWAKSAIIEDKVLFAPIYGNDFVLYDISNDEVYHLKADINDEFSRCAKYWEVIAADRNFYIMGNKVPVVTRINAYTREMVNICEWKAEDYKELTNEKKRFCFGDGHAIIGNKLYAPFCGKDKLFEYDYVLDKYEIIGIRTKVCNFFSISNDGANMWITGNNEKTVCVHNPKTGASLDIDIPEAGTWFAPVFLDGFAFLFPENSNAKIYKINMESYEVIEVEKMKDLDQGDQNNRDVWLPMWKEEHSFMLLRKPDCTWIKLNVCTGNFSRQIYTIDDEDFVFSLKRDYFERKYGDNIKKIVIDEKNMSLDDYLFGVAMLT